MNTLDPTRKRVPQTQMEVLIENLRNESKRNRLENRDLPNGPFTGTELSLAQRELKQHLDKSLYYLLTDGSSLITISTRDWLVEMWSWTEKSSNVVDYLPLTLWPDWCRKEGVTD